MYIQVPWCSELGSWVILYLKASLRWDCFHNFNCIQTKEASVSSLNCTTDLGWTAIPQCIDSEDMFVGRLAWVNTIYQRYIIKVCICLCYHSLYCESKKKFSSDTQMLKYVVNIWYVSTVAICACSFSNWLLSAPHLNVIFIIKIGVFHCVTILSMCLPLKPTQVMFWHVVTTLTDNLWMVQTSTSWTTSKTSASPPPHSVSSSFMHLFYSFFVATFLTKIGTK